MKFRSTRGKAPALGFCEALVQGIAPDGGLYVPEAFPVFTPEAFATAKESAEVGAIMLAPFAEGTPLADCMAAICREAFSFPIPLKQIRSDDGPLYVLELFHGPTAAFKDVGARFLAACFERLEAGQAEPLTILVATSGDTGGAVAAAFHGRPNMRVIVLFPRGLVSARQERQLCCWGDNVLSLRVDGNFDDCQRMVKEAFADHDLRRRLRLSSANSINLGRLLPQAVYYAAASLKFWRQTGEPLNFIIPTGNLGNGQACVWAREMGLPIGEIVLATNLNRPIPDYLATGEWAPAASIATLASAMDVGNPSNMERLRDLLPDVDSMRSKISARSVSDQEIREQITADRRVRGETWCPHTATAAHVYDGLDHSKKSLPWALVATAHPAKFETIVEPLIGHNVDIPEALEKLLELPVQVTDIRPSLEALVSVLT
jgi:threonine synthase